MRHAAELYAAHHGEVRAFARRLVRDEAEADDLVSATFEVLPRAMENYQHAAEVRSFVLGVCANLARRFTRSSSRRRAAMERLAAEPEPAEADDPETVVARRELAQRIAEALEQLPDEQREAFILTSIEDRTAAEVARMCGVPEATVRTRLFHARRKLREALAPRGATMQRALATCAAVLLALVVGGTSWAAVTHFDAVRAWVRRAVGAAPVAPSSPARAGGNGRHAAVGGVRAPRVAAAATAATTTTGATLDLRASEPTSSALVDASSSAVAPSAPSADGAAHAGLANGGVTSDDPALALYEHAHRLHFTAHNYSAALRAWEAYLAGAPRGRFAIEARYNRGIALARTGRFAAARRALEPFARGAYNGYRRDDAADLIRAIDEQAGP